MAWQHVSLEMTVDGLLWWMRRMLWNDSEEVECEEDEDTDCEMKTITW